MGHAIRTKKARDLVVNDVVLIRNDEVSVKLVRERGQKIDVFYTDKKGQERIKEFWDAEVVQYYRSLEITDDKVILSEETPNGHYWVENGDKWEIVAIWQRPDEPSRISLFYEEREEMIRDYLGYNPPLTLYPATPPWPKP